MSYTRTVPVIFFLFTFQAHAGIVEICEAMVDSAAKTAHSLLDKSGRSYVYARALSQMEKTASSNDPKDDSVEVLSRLRDIDVEMRNSREVTAEEKAGFFEEVAEMALRIAEQREQAGEVGFGGKGMRAMYMWLSRHAIYSLGRPQIQIRIVKAIRSLMGKDWTWYRGDLERLLLDMGAVVGFTKEAAELFDSLPMRDLQELTDPEKHNLYSLSARPIIEKWRGAIELEALREYLVPALNDYTLKRAELANFNRWLDGHGLMDVAVNGPHGYRDRTPMIRLRMMIREDKRQFVNPLNAVLYQVFRYRIFYGIKNLDRVVRGDEKREPLFVKNAAYGALVIMSYMSQERNLSEAEIEERRQLIKNLSGPEHGRLIQSAIDAGSGNAAVNFMYGNNLNVDPLRDTSTKFTRVMNEHFKRWEFLEI